MPVNTVNVIEIAVNWAIDVANNDDHGYSQNHRWGNPDYDCSSLMISAYDYAFHQVGISPTPKDAGATYTGNMKSAFMSCGFTNVISTINLTTGEGLLRGDVLLNESHHTAMYIGEYNGKSNQIVHASIDEVGGITGPRGGDQTGREICIRDYYNHSSGWEVVLRYPGSAVAQTTTVSVINPDKMTPYIAVIEGEYLELNYNKLKESKVSGVMFWAGGLYDSARRKRLSPANPKLKTLVRECTNAEMPYALFWDVRSNSHIEADAECKALYYVLSNYSPKLGIWLHINNRVSKAINDDIINLYHLKLSNWGFGTKCGLYVTPGQLDRISWNRFEEKYYLWLIDHDIDLATIDNQILQPEMFEVAD